MSELNEMVQYTYVTKVVSWVGQHGDTLEDEFYYLDTSWLIWYEFPPLRGHSMASRSLTIGPEVRITKLGNQWQCSDYCIFLAYSYYMSLSS